jgi:hypothetical protein
MTRRTPPPWRLVTPIEAQRRRQLAVAREEHDRAAALGDEVVAGWWAEVVRVLAALL